MFFVTYGIKKIFNVLHLYLLGCPRQWKSYKDKCYYFSAPPEQLNYEETKEMCKNKTSTMLTIHNEDEQVYMIFKFVCIFLLIR